MWKEIKDIEQMRKILNKLAENIDTLNEKDRQELQQISEAMDNLILEYIKRKL